MNGASWRKVLEVAKTQSFGVGYDPKPEDPTTARRLLEGRIDLPPHPEWKFSNSVDWNADPFGQRNWRAQLHMLRWIDPLRRQYDAYGSDAKELWCRIVDDWATENLEPSGTTIWAWKDMVDAMRTSTLLYGSHLVGDEVRRQVTHLGRLEFHGEWLADPNNLGHSNHALHQHSALLQVGSAFGKKHWQQLAIDRMREYFATNYDDDGVNVEGAPGYWELNLRWAQEVAERLRLADHENSFAVTAISRSAEAIAHSTRPDGRLEAIGDTVSARPAARGSKYLRYVASNGAEGEPPGTTTRQFGSGYIFGRSGWGETHRRLDEETFYSLVFGRSDKVHGHQDCGSLTYFANGRPLITEAGKYSYTASAGRAYALARDGHNVVKIRGAHYAKEAVVDLVRSESNSRFDYFEIVDRGYAGIVLTRELIFAKATEALLVIDTVRSRKPVEAECRWHLAPGTQTELTAGGVNARVGNVRSSVVFGGSLPAVTVVSGSREPFEGWVSQRWHEIEPTPLVKARRTGTKFRFITAIQRVSDDRSRLETMEVEGRRGFVVRGRDSAEFISVAPDGVRVGTIDTATGTVPDLASASRRSSPFSVPDAESLVEKALTSVWHGGLDEVARRALVATVESGLDYGASALLTDAELIGGDGGEQAQYGARHGFKYDGVHEQAYVEGLLPTYPCRSVEEAAVLPAEADAVLVFRAGGLSLPVRYFRGDGSALVVGFSGALDRTRERLPRFERLRSLRELGVSTLVFADPTLDLAQDLSLGWYLGTKNYDLVPLMAGIVREVAGSLNTNRTVLVGTSGGGFAAMHTGSLVPGATVLAINPQTDVRRYHERFAKAALRVVFGSDDVGGHGRRLSVMERFAADGIGAARIVYVSNSGDGHHTANHLAPFEEWVNENQGAVDLDVRSVDWGRGHIGPNRSQFRDLLEPIMAL